MESQMQKYFWEGFIDTVDHTKRLSYITNHSRNKQGQIIITPLDLKNSFREVNHDFLMKVLNYYHLANEMNKLIKIMRYQLVQNSIIQMKL